MATRGEKSTLGSRSRAQTSTTDSLLSESTFATPQVQARSEPATKTGWTFPFFSDSTRSTQHEEIATLRQSLMTEHERVLELESILERFRHTTIDGDAACDTRPSREIVMGVPAPVSGTDDVSDARAVAAPVTHKSDEGAAVSSGARIKPADSTEEGYGEDAAEAGDDASGFDAEQALISTLRTALEYRDSSREREPKKVAPPVFSGGEKSQVSFDNWSIVIEHSVPEKWRHLLKQPPPNPDAIDEALNAKLYTFLVTQLDATSSVFDEAKFAPNDGVKLWQRLRKRFVVEGGPQLFVLHQELQRRVWRAGDTVDTFGRDIVNIQRRLAMADSSVPESLLVSHMAANVPAYLQSEAMSGVQRGVRVDELIVMLRAAEILRKPFAGAEAAVAAAALPTANKGSATGISAKMQAEINKLPAEMQGFAAMFLKAAKKPRAPRKPFKKRGARPGKGDGKGGDGKADKVKFEGECFNCGKKGHRKADCRAPRKPNDDDPDASPAIVGNVTRTSRQVISELLATTPLRPTTTPCSEPTRVTDISGDGPTRAELQLEVQRITDQYAAYADVDQKIPCASVYDSGCGQNAFNDERLFTVLNKEQDTVRMSSQLKVANGDLMKTHGVGTVKLQLATTSGRIGELVLEDCYYAPDLCVNLISHGRVVRPDRTTPSGVHFHDGGDEGPVLTLANGDTVRLSDRNSVVWLGAWATGRQGPTSAAVALPDSSSVETSDREPSPLREATVVAPVITTQPAAAAPAETTQPTTVTSATARPSAPAPASDRPPTLYQLLHVNLGHPSRKTSKLIARSLRIKMRPCDKAKCETCATQKATHQPVASKAERKARKPGEVIHFDIKGKLVKDRSGKQYVAAYVDEFTRWARAYLMEVKTEVATATERFIQDSITAPTSTIPIGTNTMIHADNDSNVLDSLTTAVLTRHGVKIRTTPPNTPQRNGIVERMWRTVFNTTRALLYDSGLPVEFWSLAVMHAVYLHNLLPTKALKMRCKSATPYEMLTGKVPNYAALKRFGCKVYVKSEDARQFDDRARVGIYVGYNEQNDSPLVYFPDTKTVVSTMHLEYDNAHELTSTLPLPDIMEESEGPVNLEPFTDLQQVVQKRAERAAKQAAKAAATTRETEIALQPSTTTDAPVATPAALQPFEPTIMLKQAPVTRMGPPVMPTAEQRAAVISKYVAEQRATKAGKSDESTTTVTTMPSAASTVTTKPSAMTATAAGSPVTQASTSVATQATRAVVKPIIVSEPSPTTSEPATRRSTRPKTKPARLNDSEFSLAALEDVPRNYNEASKPPYADKWLPVYDKERLGLRAANTYELITQDQVPEGERILPTVVNFKLKLGSDGKVTGYKARINAGGHLQRPGVDYDDVYAPVLTYTSLRVLLATAAKLGFKVHQMDAIAAFLNGKLSKPAYMWPPPGEPTHDAKGQRLVCRVVKALYGLHESPRVWNDEISAFMKREGLHRSQSDPSVYVNNAGEVQMMLITGLWVDDLVIATKHDKTLKRFKKAISGTYRMIDKGMMTWCLGMSVKQDATGIELNQAAYIDKILQRFSMADAKPAPTPFPSGVQLSDEQSPQTDQEREEMQKVPYRQAVGALIHLITCTRPDVAFHVGQLARYSANPGRAHWQALKHLLRYLAATKQLSIRYTRNDPDGDKLTDLVLTGYVDASWGSETDDRKSVTGYVMTLAGGPVAWMSKRQSITAQSTAEAEYVAASSATSEVLYLRKLLSELGMPQMSATTLFEDNQPCIQIANNPGTSARTKHIALRYHAVRERVANGEVKLVYVPTEDQVADLLTKSVGRVILQRLRPVLMGHQVPLQVRMNV